MSIRERAVGRVTRQIVRGRYGAEADDVRQTCWLVMPVAEAQAKKLTGDRALSYVLYRRVLDELRKTLGWSKFKRNPVYFVSAEETPHAINRSDRVPWQSYRVNLSASPSMGASAEYLIREWCDGLPMRKINMAKRKWVDGLTHDEVGKEFGVSETRVCQILNSIKPIIAQRLTPIRYDAVS